LVKALLKWSVFCATVRRPMRLNPHWTPYLEIADMDLPFEEKLLRYDRLARDHFDTEAFEEFCEEHLGHLDAFALDYFGTEAFKKAVREKVTALYPSHEIDQFTDHFFGLVQFWRKTEKDRLDRIAAQRAASDEDAEITASEADPA